MSRNYCFTYNNYTDATIKQINDNQLMYKYLIYGKEIAPNTGTPHLQGYIELYKTMRLKSIKKIIGSGVHLERRKGTQKEAIDYCKKTDPNYVEYGTPAKQGKRNDIEELKTYIDKPLDDIFDVLPNMALKYAGNIKKIQQARNAKKYKKMRTELEVH